MLTCSHLDLSIENLIIIPRFNFKLKILLVAHRERPTSSTVENQLLRVIQLTNELLVLSEYNYRHRVEFGVEVLRDEGIS